MTSLYNKSTDYSLSFLVTIDGGSGVGKSTLAKLVAKAFNLHYFQTSLVYRRLAAYLRKQQIDYSNESALELNTLDLNNILEDESLELYDEEVSKAASVIAAYPHVREALLQYQLDIKTKYPRLILEGRDTGSVIAPEADLKLYIVADLKTRAERRYNQLRANQKEVTMHGVQKQLAERDERDMNRTNAPLIKPQGALELNNSDVTLAELIAQIEQYIKNYSDIM